MRLAEELLGIVMVIAFRSFHVLPNDDQKVAQKSHTLYLPLPSHRRHDDAFATGRKILSHYRHQSINSSFVVFNRHGLSAGAPDSPWHSACHLCCRSISASSDRIGE